MLTHTRIISRLAALAGIMLVFMLGIAYFGINGMRDMSASVKTIYEDRTIPLVQLAEIGDLLGDEREDLRSVALAADPAELAKLEANIVETRKKIDDIWKQYMSTYLTPEEKKLAETADKARAAYREIATKVILAARAKNMAAAAALESQDGDAAFGKINVAFDDLKQLQADVAKEEFEKSNAAFSLDSKLLAASLIVAVLLGGLAALMIARSVTTPLNAIIHVMGELTNGNLRVDVTGTERGDEVGAVSRAVAVFKDGLAETEKLRREQIEMTAKAEAERKQAMLDMADDFESQVGNMVKGVAAAATEMQATAQSLAASSEQTKQQASNVAAAAEQTTQNVQTVASATEELSASFREINERVTESTTIIGQAVDEAHSTSARVHELEEAAQRIGTVVALITDIADQTNLLALNATIEAARAGDAGKGFAVVASEVKVLSAQTAKATDEIRAQISAIQKATRSSTEAIATISKTIGRVNEISSNIAAAVEQQTAATGEISRSVSQAAQGTAEVTSNVNGVSEAAMSSTASAHEVLTAADQLSRDSEGLSAQVHSFLSTVRAGAQHKAA